MKLTRKNCLKLRSGQTVWRAIIHFNGLNYYGYVDRIMLKGKRLDSNGPRVRIGRVELGEGHFLRDVWGYGNRVGAFTKKVAADRWLAEALASHPGSVAKFAALETHFDLQRSYAY